MPLELIAAPAAEPVTLDQAKAWLRVESGNDEDALLSALIPAARARAEWHTGRAFVSQRWTLWLDRSDGRIELPLPPLQSIESVTFYAPDGGAIVLESNAYAVAGQYLLLDTPPTGLRAANGIAVAFTAGYGEASDVPPAISQAILALVAALYEHRGGDGVPTPDNALALLAPYRTIKL
jgi:uncharacterized phiE125 gp8 family phage protein